VALDELIGADTTTAISLLRPALVQIPSEFTRYPELNLGSQVHVRLDGDTLLVGFSALNDILRLMLSTGKVDTVRPPIRLRRGVATKALESNFVKEGFRYDRALGSISVTDGIWRRSNGQVVLVHMDSRAIMDGRKLISVRATAYITLLTADLRQACVDARIDAPDTSRPVVAILGDTAYVVDQRLTSPEATTTRTILRRFVISDTECRWTPVLDEPV